MKPALKAPSNRVSAFLLIAVAIPTFGLVLRIVIETPPSAAASTPGRDSSAKVERTPARDREAAAEVLAYQRKFDRWKSDPKALDADALYDEAKSLADRYAGTRFAPALRERKEELRAHLQAASRR